MASRAQLFIGRLPIDVRERDVEQLFEKYGRLLRCDVKYGMYGSTGRRGSGRTGMAYAFVDYDDRRDAEDAIKYENGREMRGQSIVVEWARGPSYRSGSSGFQRNSSYSRSGEECYRCQRTGHWARDCPDLERDNRYYPRSRNRSRSRSRSRSFRRRRISPEHDSDNPKEKTELSLIKRRSPSRSRSRSRERRRSTSRDKRTKARSPSRSLTKSPSPSRSRSREKTKKIDKSAKPAGRDASKSPSKSRSPSRSISRSPLPERNVNEGNHQGSEGDRFRESLSPSPHKSVSRSVSKEKNRESDDAGSYRSASRSKSR